MECRYGRFAAVQFTLAAPLRRLFVGRVKRVLEGGYHRIAASIGAAAVRFVVFVRVLIGGGDYLE